MSSPRLRFGLMGLGIHGARYARHLAAGDIPGATLGAVWTRDEAKRARWAADLKVVDAPTPKALAQHEEVDAIIIVVPVGRHLEMVEVAAAAEKPILLEKPMAPSAIDARAMIAAAGTLPFTIAQTLRFDPLVEGLRAHVESGTLGGLTGFAAEQRLEPRDVSWEDDGGLAAGGVIMQTGIHIIDSLLHVTRADAFRLIGAHREKRSYREMEDHAAVALRLTGGAAARGVSGILGMSKLGQSRHHRISLFFEDGGVEADFVDRALWITRGRERSRQDVPQVPTICRVVEAFANHVRGHAPNPVPAAEGARAIEVVDAAYRYMASAPDGGWMDAPQS